MPERAPPKKPPQDFPSPNILLPRQDLPKSIFVPPPKTTAAELGSIAGRNSQRPFSVYEMTSKASIGIWMRGTSIKLKVPFCRQAHAETGWLTHREGRGRSAAPWNTV